MKTEYTNNRQLDMEMTENGWVVITSSHHVGYFYQFKDRQGNIREIKSKRNNWILKLKVFLAKHLSIGGKIIA